MTDIDWSKPVELVHREGSWPVVASFVQPDGSRLVILKNDDGRHMTFDDSWTTFRNVRRKVKHEAWANLNSDGTYGMYSTRVRADEMAYEDRIECRHIEWEADADE